MNTTQVATPLKRLSIRVQKSFSYSHTSYFKDRYCHTPQSCPHMKTKSHTLYSCCQTQTRALKAAVNQRKREPRPLKLRLMHRAHHTSQLLSDAEDHTLHNSCQSNLDIDTPSTCNRYQYHKSVTPHIHPTLTIFKHNKSTPLLLSIEWKVRLVLPTNMSTYMIF